jgi:hypothetical protein
MYLWKEHIMAHRLDPAILAAQKKKGMKIVPVILPNTVPNAQQTKKK